MMDNDVLNSPEYAIGFSVGFLLAFVLVILITDSLMSLSRPRYSWSFEVKRVRKDIPVAPAYTNSAKPATES